MLYTLLKTCVTKLQLTFKSRTNQHILECRDGVSSCRFPRHAFHCGTKKGNLMEPFPEVSYGSW